LPTKQKNAENGCSMFILTQASQLENSKNNIYRVQDTALEKQYLNAGYHRYERSYIIKESHREYAVICPEFRNRAKGLEPIVVIPGFLVPRRPYPVYVYLYAIDLYSSAPEKGQRWAAEETRKYFGLATFSHTTLGRALKAFVRNLGSDAIELDEAVAEPSGAAEKKSNFPTVQTTESLRKQAAQILQGRLIRAKRQQISAICSGLVRERFKAHQRFLL
jgi:hypothetical protein